MAEIVGKQLYPNVRNKTIRLYLDQGVVERKCTGYDVDNEGESIMFLEDIDGDQFVYRRKDLNRFEILKK